MGGVVDCDILEGCKEYIIELPKTQEEFDRRFSLWGSEDDMNEVEFNEISLDEISALMVKLPKTQEEFDRRFS